MFDFDYEKYRIEKKLMKDICEEKHFTFKKFKKLVQLYALIQH